MRTDIVWTGGNLDEVTEHLYPLEHGSLTRFRRDNADCLSLLAFGVLYDLPIGCRLVRTADGTVSVDATQCAEAVGWVDEANVHTKKLITWRALCAPTTTEKQ